MLICLALSLTLATAKAPSIAVLPLTSKGKIAKHLASILDDLVLSAVQENAPAGTRVIGQSDIDRLASLPGQAVRFSEFAWKQ